MGIRGFLLLVIVATILALWIPHFLEPAPEYNVDPRCLEEIDLKLKEMRDIGFIAPELMDISSSSFPHCDFEEFSGL